MLKIFLVSCFDHRTICLRDSTFNCDLISNSFNITCVMEAVAAPNQIEIKLNANHGDDMTIRSIYEESPMIFHVVEQLCISFAIAREWNLSSLCAHIHESECSVFSSPFMGIKFKFYVFLSAWIIELSWTNCLLSQSWVCCCDCLSELLLCFSPRLCWAFRFRLSL